MEWSNLKNHVKDKYQKHDEGSDWLQFILPTRDGRTQLLYLNLHTVGQEEWVEIISPIADVGEVDLPPILEEVGEMTLGGLISMNGTLWLRHSVPLANVDPNEIFEPFKVISFYADVLEEKYTSLDLR